MKKPQPRKHRKGEAGADKKGEAGGGKKWKWVAVSVVVIAAVVLLVVYVWKQKDGGGGGASSTSLSPSPRPSLPPYPSPSPSPSPSPIGPGGYAYTPAEMAGIADGIKALEWKAYFANGSPLDVNDFVIWQTTGGGDKLGFKVGPNGFEWYVLDMRYDQIFSPGPLPYEVSILVEFKVPVTYKVSVRLTDGKLYQVGPSSIPNVTPQDALARFRRFSEAKRQSREPPLRNEIYIS